MHTHALRLKLRDANGLQLPDKAYQEYKAEWDALSDSERQHLLDNAYTLVEHDTGNYRNSALT
jgi:hypothetical protein